MCGEMHMCGRDAHALVRLSGFGPFKFKRVNCSDWFFRTLEEDMKGSDGSSRGFGSARTSEPLHLRHRRRPESRPSRPAMTKADEAATWLTASCPFPADSAAALEGAGQRLRELSESHPVPTTATAKGGGGGGMRHYHRFSC